ncbi:membrane protease YdiL (CAAX protease family) [Catalinimonas alkaloidigena]|uniref:CPBP family intramembrane glutamic endopeptidase n=1 Tax=Catalinimonas alkaloidigena TaxID=1075417 RepID=UPI002405900A|nr:CPBP family intramembrane glutamic endopeptidase [Catalinimonas alkaloidigena]MDF9795977.1 membrane protease YdiL (CAAX protease family) [Catalinimonas alkaloidigena]
MSLSSHDYRKAFRGWIRPGWATAIVLLFVFSSVRFVLVLQANVNDNYQYISYFFVMMILLPFVCLNGQGQKSIGIDKVSSWKGIGWGAFFGVVSCTLLFGLMNWFYGKTDANAFTYISHTYKELPEVMDSQSRLMYFAIFAGVSMLFSPLGEELFYRGLIHENIAFEVGHNNASVIDSLAFSLVHLSHFGIVYLDGSWQFLFWPSILWMLGLYISCRLFYFARVLSGTILGAIVAHASMAYYIFYHILG